MTLAVFRGILLFATLVLVVPLPGSAQDFRARHYTLDDGLPSSHVQDITQDGLGRMWFATRSGIASYDGLEWTVYNLTDGLSWVDTFALEWDTEGILWSVSSASPFKVSHFRNGRWNAFPEPYTGAPDSTDTMRIHAFAVAGQGSERRIAIGTSSGLLIADGNSWRLRTSADGLPSDEVMALEATGDDLVVATARGLARLRGDRIDRILDDELPTERKDVKGLVAGRGGRADGSGRLWVLGNDWIGRIDAGKLTVVRDELPLPPMADNAPRLAVADGRGGLYLGGAEFFFHLDHDGALEALGRSNGLLSDGVTAVYVDREDNLWVGSRRGLSKISNRRFATFNRRHGLLDDEVTAVLASSDGRMVLAHPGGLSWLQGTDVRKLELARRLPILAERSDRVRDLTEDGEGNLWVPTFGLVKVEPSGRLQHYGAEQGLDGAVDAVLAAQGRLWAATSQGLFQQRGGRFEPVPGTQSMRIRRIVSGSQGEIHLATDSGLYTAAADAAAAGVWRPRKCRDVVPCNSVFAVHERPAEPSLWIGTAAGLYKTRGELLVQESSPAIHHPIFFIVEDAVGRTWFGIDNGVLRFDGRNLDHFTVRDGLAGRETFRAAGFVDAEGRVWIGSERGVTVYTDDPGAPPRGRPNVTLTSFEAAGQALPFDRESRLPVGASDVLYRFRAISLVDEQRLQVRWKLEGLEDTWRRWELYHRQDVRYTNLEPGSYRLHVEAASVEGLQSGAVSSAPFRVTGPYWRQPGFFVVAGLVIAAALYFLQSLVAHKRYSRRLEAEVAERVEQLRKFETELANSQKLDAIGVLAGGIAHDFNNFLTVLNGNLSLLSLPGRSERERAEDLADAQAAILRASKLTQQLLTFSRGGAPVRKAASIHEIVEDSASFVLSGSNVRCRVDLPEDLHVVEIDAGQIHQLFNNLLINATQAMPDGGTVRILGRNLPVRDMSDVSHLDGHAELWKIAASMSPPPQAFVAIEVADEGAGMTPEILARIFDPYFTTKDEGRGLGLASSYSIARRHDGLLTAKSVPGRGATFTLYLPASEMPASDDESQDSDVAPGYGRILIMDDEESVRRVIGEICRDLGYEPVDASDGDEAVELYSKAVVAGRAFDAVVMDLTIPGGTGGKETLRRLRGIDPSVRAIVISGYSNDPVMANYREHGFQARLAKPFRTKDLAQVLREVVGDTRVGSALRP